MISFSSVFFSCQVDKYKVTSPFPLGSLLLVRLEKQRYWVEDNWFCRYVTVEHSGGDTVVFPCYRWLIGNVNLEIRQGKGRKIPSIQSKLLIVSCKHISVDSDEHFNCVYVTY